MFIFASIWAYVEESLRGIACWAGLQTGNLRIMSYFTGGVERIVKGFKSINLKCEHIARFFEVTFFCLFLQVKNLTNVKFAASHSRSHRIWSRTAESTQVESAMSVCLLRHRQLRLLIPRCSHRLQTVCVRTLSEGVPEKSRPQAA